MNKEKLHLRVAKREDGSLAICDQKGREISGVSYINLNLTTNEVATVNIIADLYDSNLKLVNTDKLDIKDLTSEGGK